MLGLNAVIWQKFQWILVESIDLVDCTIDKESSNLN